MTDRKINLVIPLVLASAIVTLLMIGLSIDLQATVDAVNGGMGE